ncbi:hypothetical protein DL96DRAFT_1608021 [Flagelloscypha sp. PMI_526]|nr:hypothetical protein DL96DRAFT_1608021 [Flagelloscypha sp. PMI_526]
MLRAMTGRGGTLRRVTPRSILIRPLLRPPHPLLCPRVLPPTLVFSQRQFHSTPPRNGAPLLPILIGALKSSTALEVARTITRIAMSMMPILFLTTVKSKHKLQRAEERGEEHPRRAHLLKQIQAHSYILRVMVALPTLLFFATLLASLERTPLTGRWRMILLSPEEEEEVAAQLAGAGWYTAVTQLLQRDGNPKLVHPSDWRYQWVRETLRDLEQAIPTLLREQEVCPNWYLQSGPDDLVLPPPADYPLRPRPRASDYLRCYAERMCHRSPPPAPHTINGPPYSLLLVEDPNALNAFSYGFGPDGAGGIVVYTGFIDDVLRRIPSAPVEGSKSWWGSLTGAYTPRQPEPSKEQTSELAILLAHELSHLILSHHLESLSSAQVIMPGILSIVTDIIRVMLFPVTVVFGPFASDAITNVAKMGTSELEKASQQCTTVAQEIEADQVSTRLLAHAGYDPRTSISFWEKRQVCESLDPDSDGVRTDQTMASIQGVLPRWMKGAGHPFADIRVGFLEREMKRWETERRAMRKRLTFSEDECRSAVNLLAA